MYATTAEINFLFTLSAVVNPPADIDLVFSNPEGVTTFHPSGTDYGAKYVPPVWDDDPTLREEGTYIFKRTFDIAGIWSVILADGDSALSYLILANQKIILETSNPVSVTYVTFPENP